ncbi:MAG: hypothetical protein HPAVJP_5600 [Candidatus Hepatoplasma vulgare]|nr:MAG: hypothetical protein HPAVJP_5600 [Candidatus Hepatoplasma sp.]
MKKFSIKNFIWFFIFLGLGMIFIYFTVNTKYEIDHYNYHNHNDSYIDLKLYKILFSASIFFDFGFLTASFWNLYICIKLIFKKEENK